MTNLPDDINLPIQTEDHTGTMAVPATETPPTPRLHGRSY